MRILVLLLLAGAGVSSAFGEARAITAMSPEAVAARFGEPAGFDRGVLQYPGFTLRLVVRSERLRPADLPPWMVYEFELSYRDAGQTFFGGTVIFNSEARANGRRFDIAGHIYVAEMFHSTAGLEPGAIVPITARLAANQIVVWDEATARARNHPLAHIWRDEQSAPKADYYPAHAYASGVLLAGFTPPLGKTSDTLLQLKAGSLDVERVALLSDEPSPPLRALPCAYGQRGNFRAGALKYPDLTLVLVSREERNPVDPYLSDVSYQFKAYAAGATAPGPRFSSANGANGSRFRVGPATYLAEMFFSTAGGAGKTEAKVALGPDEVIVWDQASARRENPRGAVVFGAASGHPDYPDYPDAFASGVSPGIGFTGTYMIGSQNDPAHGWSNPAELDAPPAILADAKLEYPAAYAGTGLKGWVGGYLMIEPDGTVGDALTTHGSDEAFQGPSARALRAMRFTVPKRKGQPTRVMVNFLWSIAEPNCDTRSVRFLWPEGAGTSTVQLR